MFTRSSSKLDFLYISVKNNKPRILEHACVTFLYARYPGNGRSGYAQRCQHEEQTTRRGWGGMIGTWGQCAALCTAIIVSSLIMRVTTSMLVRDKKTWLPHPKGKSAWDVYFLLFFQVGRQCTSYPDGQSVKLLIVLAMTMRFVFRAEIYQKCIFLQHISDNSYDQSRIIPFFEQKAQ